MGGSRKVRQEIQTLVVGPPERGSLCAADLFERLPALRKRLAGERNVPANVVFSCDAACDGAGANAA